MPTTYDAVHERFLYKVKAYNLLSLGENNRTAIIQVYLDASVAKFYKACRTDLTNVDSVLKQFNETLAPDEMDILTDLMVVEWLSPQLYSEELLESRLNLKDYTEYSPSKLIDSIRAVYTETKKRVRQSIIDYTYSHGDVGDLNK